MTRPRSVACHIAALALGLSVLAADATPAFVLIGVADEAAIGRRAEQAMRGRTPRTGDSRIDDYVATVGRRLASVAGGPPYQYTFRVANYADVNAITLPAGHIWVYRGAIATAATEAELAGVMAHEVAHAALRHPAAQISDAMLANMGLTLLGALLGNSGGASTSTAAAHALTGSAFLAYSREDERQADKTGTGILAKAGWDARGLEQFLERARTQSRRDPSALAVFFSTHPALEARIRDLAGESSRGPHGRVTSSAFADVKRRLARLPPAGRAPRA